MAVTPENLIAPAGPLEKALFPGEHEEGDDTFLERVTAYVSQATTKAGAYDFATTAEEDAAIEAWALHLAFRAAYTLSLTRPAEEDSRIEVLGRVIYADDQRRGLKELQDYYFSAWLDAIVNADDGSRTLSTGTPSHSTPVTFEF